MADAARIVFAAAEAVPYAKAGGLADIAGALPGQLVQRGHDVTLFLPYYRAIDKRRFPAETILTGELASFGDRTWRVLERRDAGLRVLFLDQPAYFDRAGVYTDPLTGEAYPDDGERFLFFSLALLETMRLLGEPVDLIHCNDYHTGMVPLLLDRNYRQTQALAKTVTVYSIHNLAYQGIFPPAILPLAGITATEMAFGAPFEFWGKVNFMKAGILGADLIATVSPRYAEEIQSSAEFGYGLEGVLSERQEDLVGILNGIDTQVWSPEIDGLIARNYDAETVDAGKAANKQALLEAVGLKPRAGQPVLGVISRLVSQKGFDLFAPIMQRLMSLPLQLIVLGTGEKVIETLFQDFAERYPGQFALALKFDERLAHGIEAGADFFLMPSRYEPCGLNQMYSLRYGTIPIVRLTGGLADSVVDIDTDAERGTGFGFEDYEPEALLATIRRALACYRQKDRFAAMRRRAMALDLSWTSSALAYDQLYRAALAKGRRRREGGEPRPRGPRGRKR